tara:strand:- start:4351 stop:4566 length:216 start_codon:yes stop_codon:yes gene_type:complete
VSALKIALISTPFLLAASFIYANGTPHILWEYEYYGSREHPRITSCTYFGIYGMHSFSANECPFIDFIPLD